MPNLYPKRLRVPELPLQPMKGWAKASWHSIGRTGLIFLVLRLSPAFAGGGWTLPQGSGWLEAGVSYLNYDQLFRGSEPLLPLRRPVTDLGVKLYAEYGVLDQWTVMGQLPYRLLQTSDSLLETSDFTDTLPASSMAYWGNFRLGSRYRLVNRPNGVLSVQLWVESNNSNRDLYKGLQTGFDAWSVEPSIAFGSSYWISYFSGMAGIAIRSNGYSEEFLSQLEYGIRPVGNWWLIGVMDVRLNFRNGERGVCSMQHTGLYVDRQEAISYGLKTIVPFSDSFGITAGVYGAVFADQLPAAFSLNGGLYWKPDFRRSHRNGTSIPDAAPLPGE